jgi:hypothetical protein
LVLVLALAAILSVCFGLGHRGFTDSLAKMANRRSGGKRGEPRCLTNGPVPAGTESETCGEEND